MGEKNYEKELPKGTTTKQGSLSSCVLFRPCYNFIEASVDEEYEICKQHLPTYKYRTEIPVGSIVFGRYSVLPYYRELEEELANLKCQLVNSHKQHLYIADMMNYYEDISQYTFETHTTWGHIESGQWVLKGRTNSRKHQWNTHMFADGRAELLDVAKRLLDDPFIGDQGLVVRKYIPLENLGEGINGLPVTNEHRLFFYKENLICHGFYWSEHPEVAKELDSEGLAFAQMIANKISQKTNFFVLDIAKTAEGEWIVVEVNDGQMSGLSDNDPEVLYRNLRRFVASA